MGDHKGWRIRQDRSGKWRAEVWDNIRQAYRSQTWPSPAEARQWAKDQAAGVVRRDPAALAGGALVAMGDPLEVGRVRPGLPATATARPAGLVTMTRMSCTR